MKDRLFRRNRRGVARRSVGFSLVAVIIMSTFLSFAAQIVQPKTAYAVKPDLTKEASLKLRSYLYMAECLTNWVDVDGKANDGNNRNPEFEAYSEMWKKYREEVIVVGLDYDPNNGVATCISIAGHAIKNYKPDTANHEVWLERELWGKSIEDNGYDPIPVGNDDNDDVTPAQVRLRATQLAARLASEAVVIASQYDDKKYILGRLKPLVNQCYKSWTEDPSDVRKYNDDEDIKYPDRELFADHRDFEAKDISYIKQNNGAGSFTNSEIGDIELGFLPGQTGSTFNSYRSDWYPIGNDLGRNFLGNDYFKNHEGQTFLDCGWIKRHPEFLFKRSANNRYYFRPSKNAKAEAIIVRHTSTGDTSAEDGSAENEEVVEDQDVIATSSTSGDGTDDPCGSGSGGGALRWILCPVVSAINDGIQWATDNVIGPSLEMRPLENGGTLYEAWRALRDVANAFLVVLFLVIIFASFFASEKSSYTVKKALPRIVAAAILIQASYFFSAILIDIGNVLGDGIGKLILDATGNSAGGSGASTGAAITSTLLVGGAIAGGAVIATILGAWMLLLPLAIGLVISILTLILSLGVRLIALNLLIMLSPVAFLAWIMPNTDKYFKMWATNIVKLVMMYPMIIAMMAAAQVVVKVGAGNSNDTFVGVLTLFAPMIAFFMIPATFKASGTMISSINGALASKGKSFSNATAGTLRKNTLKDMKDKAAVNLYNTQGQKGFRRGLARVASGNAFSFGSTGRKKIRKTQDEGLAARTELAQDEYRDVQNAPLMKDLLDRRAKGKLSNADELAMLDLIASRGGTLELADYFAQLESEGKVTRNAKGGVENIDDETWGKISKKHGPAIAAALPHTTGKAMQSQDGAGLNRAKGAHPASEMKREFDDMVARGDTAAKQQTMQQFYDAVQRDDAGSMDKAMVATLQDMLKDSEAADTEFRLSDGTLIKAKDLFARQINNGRLTRFVQPS